MEKIKLYTCYNKAGFFLTACSITSIHAGKADDINDISCIGDDTGDNISFKYPFYGGLTAQYWAWKNAEPAEYIGFMSAHHHFNFSSVQSFAENSQGQIEYPVADDIYEKKFAIDDATICGCLQDADIIVPKKRPFSFPGCSAISGVSINSRIKVGNYRVALEIALNLNPEYECAVAALAHSDTIYLDNIYIMRSDLLDCYFSWLFPILLEVEKHVSLSHDDSNSENFFWHLAEIFLNVFITHHQNQTNLRVRELQSTVLKQDRFNGSLHPFYSDRNIPIVISFDKNYLLAGVALINSIVSNSCNDYNYDIIVLEDDISSRDKYRIKEFAECRNNISVRFFDVNVFSELAHVYTRAHFTPATYARLFIPFLFREYEKIIFIDADAVVECDISELFCFDIGTYLIAAVKDIVMEGFVKFGTLSHSSDGVMPAGEYLRDTLCMANVESYFQAGVVIFNIAYINNDSLFEKMMAAMKDKQYWFLDQDIMNQVFFGRVLFLPMCWNVYHGNGNMQSFFSNLNFSTYLAFLQARRDPKIIHYAGENKPWIHYHVDFFDNFQKNIINTPWQSDFIIQLNSGHPASRCKQNGKLRPLQFRHRFNFVFLAMKKLLFPHGSRRKYIISKLLFLIRRKF